MPDSNATNNTGQVHGDETEIESRTRTLTPEQKRILAAKLYEMLRNEMRIERERLAVPHRLF